MRPSWSLRPCAMAPIGGVRGGPTKVGSGRGRVDHSPQTQSVNVQPAEPAVNVTFLWVESTVQPAVERLLRSSSEPGVIGAPVVLSQVPNVWPLDAPAATVSEALAV